MHFADTDLGKQRWCGSGAGEVNHSNNRRNGHPHGSFSISQVQTTFSLPENEDFMERKEKAIKNS